MLSFQPGIAILPRICITSIRVAPDWLGGGRQLLRPVSCHPLGVACLRDGACASLDRCYTTNCTHATLSAWFQRLDRNCTGHWRYQTVCLRFRCWSGLSFTRPIFITCSHFYHIEVWICVEAEDCNVNVETNSNNNNDNKSIWERCKAKWKIFTFNSWINGIKIWNLQFLSWIFLNINILLITFCRKSNLFYSLVSIKRNNGRSFFHSSISR